MNVITGDRNSLTLRPLHICSIPCAEATHPFSPRAHWDKHKSYLHHANDDTDLIELSCQRYRSDWPTATTWLKQDQVKIHQRISHRAGGSVWSMLTDRSPIIDQIRYFIFMLLAPNKPALPCSRTWSLTMCGILGWDSHECLLATGSTVEKTSIPPVILAH